jgi:hypothetical protein
MLDVAFKEWAMICGQLATGKQALILRKGGIAEEEGVFRPEFDRFWLYPTYFHEPAHPERPPAGTVVITHWVEVAEVQYAEDLEPLLRLAGLHGWTEETVRQRYAYRSPGLYVLTVRAFRGPRHSIVESAEYAGCKTWVHLAEALGTEGSQPVMDDATFEATAAEIRHRLTG